MSIRAFAGERFEMHVPVLVIGAGACGLTAALAARDGGQPVLVLERDTVPMGTTAMSSGMIPAAATGPQRAAGVTDDDPARHAADLVAKTKGRLDRAWAEHVTTASSETVDWLVERHGLPLTLVESAGVLPGHSRSRLHGMPNRSGAELIAGLQEAATAAGVDILTEARATTLIVDADRRVRAVEIVRPDGGVETIGCDALILACCGFAGNPALVARYLPEIAGATAHTHPGAQGDALRWGEALGAATADLTGYQGHANLAAGHGLLLQWIALGEGGIQVNREGRRFADESRGYSEQAVDVVAQTDGVAWTIFDRRIDGVLRDFAEYRELVAAGALRSADSVGELAREVAIDPAALAATFDEVAAFIAGRATDPLGRRFDPARALAPPLLAVKVTGALFHTQGGLEVDADARVLGEDRRPLPNLFAGGGAARGVSGPTAAGYVAGNGLMTATALGRLAGRAAAALVTTGDEEVLAR